MLKGEVLDVTSKNRYTVSFFEDDSIDIVRQKIGASLDIHPDRLFILVGEKFNGDYYLKDPRHWEALFRRLSYDGSPLEQTVFQEYQLQYRTPNTTVGFRPYDKIEWMSKPDPLGPLIEGPEFIEYRIFGVEEIKSYVLPISNINAQLASRIQATELPIPEVSSLFLSLHDPSRFVRFLVRPYDDTAEAIFPVYYPFLRATTPPRLTEESVRLLGKNSKLLDDLLKMESPEPKEVTILRARFYIPFVDTDLGSAIRTRFEQIFYGLTVSKETPYIGYFTAKDHISRHKFYTEDVKTKKPFVNMDNWASWWSVKPARNIPTLILFRGESKTHFDRVAITASDIVVTTYRQEGNTETIEELKKSAFKWLSTFDAVTPFLAESDTKMCRWELQDLSFLAKYSGKLEEFDLMRFNCISSIFDIADKSKTQFTLLRTDNTNNGLSAVEVKVLQMMKDGNAKPESLAEELSIPIQNARELILQVESRIDEDPRLGDKSLRGYPTLRVGAESIIVSSVNSLDRALKYSNLLRYILSSPDSPEIDAICPKRMERVTVDTSVVPSTTLNVDAAIAEEYADLFGEFEGEEEVLEEEHPEETQEEVQRISTKSDRGSTYNYFKSRLQKFDPETFDPEGSLYPKKCEQKHQPIILSEADKTRLHGTPYDASEYLEEKKKVDVVEPDGTIVCPEYWCMKDQIPLREDQLEKEKGEIQCPVCHGKLQTKSTDSPREYPLIKRETGFLYPGFVDYNAPKNGKPMPCCFKKPRSEKTLKETDDKYYILGETKIGTKPLRVAFLTPQLINLLRLTEDYSVLDGSRRLQNGMSAFFRTILLNSSETLPTCLGLKTKIPSPRENLSTILKCSFLRTWKTSGTKHVAEIENKLKDICPYKSNPIVREELAKIISGIDEAFEAKKMSRLEELEYSSLALNCDVFRIYTESNTLGCMFYAPMVRARTRAIIVLQNGSEFDVLSHVTRLPRGFVYQSNIFQTPFKKETYALLEKLRNQACVTEIPSFDQALNVMQQIGSDDFSVVMDPFGQGQALFVRNKIVLPFRNTPLPNVIQHKLLGYRSLDKEDLPVREEILPLLEAATKFSKGYTYKEDLYNASGQVVELLLESGLRVPVQPIQKEVAEPLEVIETVATQGESVLTFGKPSEELRETQKSISYSEEVFQFLLFQLTKDIRTDYRELRTALQEVRPKQPDVEPLLQKWFADTTQFVNLKDSTEFISKIRTPCGQFKSKDSCSGNLCGWDGKVCRIQIKPSIQKDRLFHRLLSTLIDNSKIRAVVLDGHTTPFFSTILYVELPHEVIMTDTELP